MASTYTNNLTIEKQGSLENLNTWGEPLLNQAIRAIDEFWGATVVSVSDGATTLQIVTASTSPHRKMYVEIVGTLTSSATLVIPQTDRVMFVKNSATGSFSFAVTVNGGGGPAVTVAFGEIAELFSDGVGVYRALTMLDVTDGGTGKTVASSVFNMMVADAGVSTTAITGTAGLVRTATTAEALTSIADAAILTPATFLTTRKTLGKIYSFVSATTALVSLDANVKGFWYWVQGAGGAGGTVSCTTLFGGGGASGAFAHGFMDLTVGGFSVPTTLSIVVGEGGDPTTLAATSGEDGGTSEIVGFVSCVGGSGAENIQGVLFNNVVIMAVGGSAGSFPAYSVTGSTQKIIYGESPTRAGKYSSKLGTSQEGITGGGGNPGMLGWGAPSRHFTAGISSAGLSGRGGGGGGGAAVAQVNSSVSGGRGGDGYVIIWTMVA